METFSPLEKQNPDVLFVRSTSPATRYALAVLITGAALLLRRLFDPVLGESGPFLPLYAAVAFTSVYFGTGPSILATLIGLIGSTYWFLSREDTVAVMSRSHLAFITGYLLVSGIIIVLSERRRRVVLMLEAAHDNLEYTVEERTRQLTEVLSKLQAEINTRREAEEAIRKLSVHLLRIQDDEHRRIARELHDSMGQTLAALKMTAGSLQHLVPPTPLGSKYFDEANGLIDQAIREMRTISYLLHPPLLDEVGFASAARWFVTGFAKRSGIEIKLAISTELRFAQSIELALFRVLQESLTNILRHSQSKTAEVRLDAQEQNIILSVKDYGIGIAPDRLEKFLLTGAEVGVGLGGMRERARDLGGKLELHNHGAGTTVEVTLPVVKVAATQHSGLAALSLPDLPAAQILSKERPRRAELK
jgi:signal transduction histidine kinase